MPMRFETDFPTTGALQLQVCGACGRVNYPSRELCGNCLADDLGWQAVNAAGTVQSLTELHYSLENHYQQHLPWPVASVKLDCGPVALAHLQPGTPLLERVSLRVLSDRDGNRMLVALRNGTDSASSWLETINFREDSP